MFFIIIILFVLYGWIEFETFVLMTEAIGGFWAFLGIFLTAFIGLSLLKSQSRAIIAEVQKNMLNPQLSIVAGLSSGVALITGAILMLVPGYATDAIGLICFTPGIRPYIGLAIISWLKNARFSAKAAHFNFSASPFSADDATRTYTEPEIDAKEETIEGDFTEKK